jgi:hypothetical protein
VRKLQSKGKNYEHTSSAPASAFFGGDPGVTGLAERHQVLVVMCSAFGQRRDVVDFLGGRIPAKLSALLAERVRSKKSLSDLSPASAIAFRCFGVTLVAVVMAVNFSFVFLTVPALHQLGTAGEGTRPLGFSGHRPPPGIKKDPKQSRRRSL